jgi:hypothetical protein
MEPATKVCHQCGEEIKRVARKCPFCQSWQKGIGAAISNPAIAPVLAFVPLLLIFYFFYTDLFRNRSEEFEKHRSSVVVQDSRIHYSKEEDGAYISTIGTLKNNGDKKWKRVQLEVQYFNQNGALIDTQTQYPYDSVLLPHTEHAFRLRQQADKPATEYITHKVFIRDAAEGDRWP